MSTVTRPAIGFKWGKYPRKNFECSRAQFVAANGRTGTVPVGLCPRTRNHYVGEPNDLDGITGSATFTVDEGGDLLPLRLDIPDWVNGLANAKGYKLSAVFDSRDSRKLQKFDFVRDPHVAEAVLLADDPVPAAEVSFAEDGDEGDEEPDDPYQRTHEGIVALHGGKYCKGAGHKPGASQAHKQWQMFHDGACDDGAECQGDAEDYQPGPMFLSQPTQGSVKMSTGSINFSQEQLDEMDPDVRAIVLHAQEAEARNAKLREKIQLSEAVAFADSLIAVAKPVAPPAARREILDMYALLAKDDDQHGPAVTFSDGKEVQANRVDAFKAIFAKLPVIAVKGEQVRGGDGSITLSHEPDETDRAAADAKRQAERTATQEWTKARNGTAR